MAERDFHIPGLGGCLSKYDPQGETSATPAASASGSSRDAGSSQAKVKAKVRSRKAAVGSAQVGKTKAKKSKSAAQPSRPARARGRPATPPKHSFPHARRQSAKKRAAEVQQEGKQRPSKRRSVNP